MKKIIVYDFDKTLTYRDTLFDFFRFASDKNIYYPFKVIVYFISMVLTKFNLLSNKTLKSIGVALFLKGLEKKIFINRCENYYLSIEFNQLYKKLSFAKDVNYYIVSASFEDYLIPIFPSFVKILGSTIEYKNGRVERMGRNCYKIKKVDYLKEIGVERIDTLFTDSFSDYPLATISDNIMVVTGDAQKHCRDINEFKKGFNR